jgi:hypothetical protein
MAFIVQTFHTPTQNVKEEEKNKPILFVDTINVSSYTVEMHGVCIRYIRENTDPRSVPEFHLFKSGNYTIKKEQDINTKPDGYYYVANEKSNIFVMYKIQRSIGIFYTSTMIEKIFTLICVPGTRVCPRLVEKNSDNKFLDFASELKSKVANYHDRSRDVDNRRNTDMILTANHIKF